MFYKFLESVFLLLTLLESNPNRKFYKIMPNNSIYV
jgi:hypothetical protein